MILDWIFNVAVEVVIRSLPWGRFGQRLRGCLGDGWLCLFLVVRPIDEKVIVISNAFFMDFFITVIVR